MYEIAISYCLNPEISEKVLLLSTKSSYIYKLALRFYEQKI